MKTTPARRVAGATLTLERVGELASGAEPLTRRRSRMAPHALRPCAVVLALAATSAKRLPALRELPAIAALGFAGYETVTRTGLAGPVTTPRETAARLAAEIARILCRPDLIDAIHKQGLEPGSASIEEVARDLKNGSVRYAALVRRINFRID